MKGFLEGSPYLNFNLQHTIIKIIKIMFILVERYINKCGSYNQGDTFHLVVFLIPFIK